MRMTPHLLAAAALVLVALVVAVGAGLVSSGEAQVPTRELSIPVDKVPPVTMAEGAATRPLVAAYASRIAQNPFEEAVADTGTSVMPNVRLPAPPPPPLALPSLPSLPLSVR